MKIFDCSQELNDEILELYKDKKYGVIIDKVSFLLQDKKEIPIGVKQKLALSYYYKGDYNNSFRYFDEIANTKNDVESWFNVLMSALALKNANYSKEIFEKIIKMHKGINEKSLRELAVPFIRYYYAYGLCDSGLYDEALEQMIELKKIYINLKVTDDTFLYIRGVPFLSQTLDLVKKIYANLGMDFANSNYVKELKNGVDRDGKRLIRKLCN